MLGKSSAEGAFTLIHCMVQLDLVGGLGTHPGEHPCFEKKVPGRRTSSRMCHEAEDTWEWCYQNVGVATYPEVCAALALAAC